MIEIANPASYLLAFSRLTIGLIFIYAFIGKVRDIRVFEQTVTNFQLLPSRLSSCVARIFLIAEFMTVVALIVGGELLFFAFALAALLLFVFSIALISVLLRDITTSCSCFGPNQKQVSIYDVWRNVVFCACAILAALVLVNAPYETANVPVFDLILLLPVAATFVAVSTNLANLINIFR